MYYKNIDEKRLIYLYCDKKLSAIKIGKILKCSDVTVRNKLKQLGIKIRNISESHIGKKASLKTKKLMSSQRQGKNHPHWKGGWRNNLPKCMDCGKAIYYHRKRCRKCNDIYNKGKNNPNWHGGKSFEIYPQEFNKLLKREVFNDWNNKCCFPKKGVSKEKARCKGVLGIHHKDYIKKNCNKTNLIPLCRKHNAVVNGNRGYWEEYFTKLIKIKS